MLNIPRKVLLFELISLVVLGLSMLSELGLMSTEVLDRLVFACHSAWVEPQDNALRFKIDLAVLVLFAKAPCSRHNLPVLGALLNLCFSQLESCCALGVMLSYMRSSDRARPYTHRTGSSLLVLSSKEFVVTGILLVDGKLDLIDDLIYKIT